MTNKKETTSNSQDEVIPQWERRVKIVKFIYSCLMKSENALEAKKEAFNKYDFQADQLQVIEYFLNNKENIIKTIETTMSEAWKFDRLNYVDQAILLEAYSEKFTWNTEKAVLIDQSVITAKKYSDTSSYKYINAVLEKVL